MKVILTYGSFDLFHIGHLNLLRKARDLGDYLIVGVSTDEFNNKKRKKAVFSYKDRAEIISSLKVVDLVIPEFSWEQKRRDVKAHQVSIFTIGSDWAGKFDELADLCTVIYLPRTPSISSTELKSNIYSTFCPNSQ